MSGSELPRPEVRDVVTIDLAEAELAAVRALLDELRDDVHAVERAAAEAEDRIALAVPAEPSRSGPELAAIDLSRQVVADLTASRREELGASEHAAYLEAQARVLEAQRRARELAEASRRDAAELLRLQLEGGLAPTITPRPGVAPPSSGEPLAGALPWADAEDGGPGWTAADEAWLDAEEELVRRDAPSGEASPAPWAAPLPPLQHWADPAAPHPAVPPAPVRERDAVAAAHEQFWREEAEAATTRSAGVSPIEVLLPTAALLILLLAVLLLIG